MADPIKPDQLLNPALIPLSGSDLFNLSWAIEEAASFAGAKEPGEDRDEFDQSIQRARESLARLEQQAKALRNLRKMVIPHFTP